MNYEKTWPKMNNLNDTITNMVIVKNLLLDYKNNKEEKFLDSIITLFEHYIEKQDEAFKESWGEFIEASTNENGEDVKTTFCEKNDQSEECKKSWTSFWEETYYPEEYYKNVAPSSTQKDIDIMPPWGHSDMEALRYTEEELNAMCNKAEMDENHKKVEKWILPIEVDGLSGECFVCFPDDLLKKAKLNEGDTIEWVDNKDGSYTLRKLND